MSNLELLVSRAVESAEFRAKLIADPPAAASEAGISLPDGAALVVHEDSSAEIHFVIGDSMENAAVAIETLLVQAQQDAAFKARFIADPARTITAETGIAIPPTLNVTIHENTAAAIHLVLPITELPGGEMSDLELEAVAGGFSISSALKKISKAISSKGISKLPSADVSLAALLKGK